MTWSRPFCDPAGFLWEALNTRGVRLASYLIVTAALFPSSRFILLLVLLVSLAVVWTKQYRWSRSPKIFYLIGVVVLLIAGYCVVRVNVQQVDELRVTRSPWGDGIALVNDGVYTGTGEGYRGPIRVEVQVRDHKIVDLRTVEYPDLISVLDNEVSEFRREVLAKGKLVRPDQPQMFRGATQTLTGYASAVESALSRGVPDFPQYSLFSRAFLNSFIGRAPDRVTLNALAILFAAFTVFEYALQSMLTPGTGRSINCYNCATCVGVCPIKEVEGVQIPMGLVLLTRLGDYERVMELSKYCVGCGKCAAKCPIGNSGPLVISAAFQASRKQREEKRRQELEETA
ncbi:MAG: 4Fe-4S dicluster domain-containing protein [Deltaproteobacteria bacterium]|nr:4Fe-4S dicluster domain-containing protein [Deltaproteobacteria bacterium]